MPHLVDISGGRRGAVNLSSIISSLKAFVGSPNKTVRLSLATLLMNIAHYLHSQSMTDSYAPDLIPIMADILLSKAYEGEAIMRTLTALGTLAMSPLGKDVANSLHLLSQVEMAASPHEAEVKAAAREVYNVLQ